MSDINTLQALMASNTILIGVLAYFLKKYFDDIDKLKITIFNHDTQIGKMQLTLDNLTKGFNDLVKKLEDRDRETIRELQQTVRALTQQKN